MLLPGIKLRVSVLASLAIFLILLSSAQAAYPPEADLGIYKEARRPEFRLRRSIRERHSIM